MDLILWRHADAHDARPGQGDLERELTSKGERQAKRMAEWLQAHLPADVVVLASPARRTQQTAAALRRPVQTLEALAPGRNASELLRAAQWPQRRGAVVVVGHQPTLGMAAAQALTGEPWSWSVGKASVWWLRSRERSGGAGIVLHAVISPELL